MQIEVHVRTSWQNYEVRDCIRHYSRLQSRKRDDAIPYSSMNFLPFISHKTYPSAGTDAIKAFLTAVPQGGSINAYFRSAIIKLVFITFHIENFFSLTFSWCQFKFQEIGLE